MIVSKPLRFRVLFTVFALVIASVALAADVTEHIKVPMTDGTKLATDVHLPDGEGPWPVVLVRSTYGRKREFVNEFVKRGMAGVVQDVRGMGQSEGEKHVFYADGWRPGFTDGADTAAWIKEQTWCDGKIGTLGGSALGITQMLLAPATKDVVAQYMNATPSNFYGHAMYHGGVFRKNMMEGWLAAIGQPHLIEVYKSHPYLDTYWRYSDSVSKAQDITAPAIWVNGWYDIFQQGTLDAFMSREKDGGEGARGNNYLIMTWSCHGPDQEQDYKFRKNRSDWQAWKVIHAFFFKHLKGDPEPLKKFAKVNYYVMGADTPDDAPGNVWRTAETWPPFPAVATPFYLGAGATLETKPTETAEASLGYDFDPNDPYLTHGGANLLLPSGPFDQREIASKRKDFLAFTTPPLEKPMELTGRVKVKLYVSSDAPDTDFTAKLLDIYPEGDGRELLILDNIQRVKLRDSLEKPAPLLTGPDQVVEIEIDLWSLSWVFNTGHRVGLHISSSNHPRFEVNPNTGADFPQEGEEMRVAHNVLHLDAAHPSALILPVRPE